MAYEYHEVANIFPMMSADEFSALVEDIRANGQRQPIYLHEGRIIDGRNRYRACQQLGIDSDTRVWDGVGSLVSFVVSLNLQRRHLTSSQKATVAMDVLPILEAEAKERQRAAGEEFGRGKLTQLIEEAIDEPRKKSSGEATQQAAQMVGTNRQYVNDAKRLRDEAPELLERVRSGELTIPQAKIKQQIAKMVAAREDRAKVGEQMSKQTNRFQLFNAPCRDALSLPRESVDWIITDPPYPREFLGVYDDLAEIAAHVLKPGGSLLCMIGQSYLPQVVRSLEAHLTYHWTLAYLTQGGKASQLFDRSVNSFWKPVLWFTKGDYARHWIGDVTKSDAMEKQDHRWQQSASGMLDLMRRFVKPGDSVMDPFLGSGTTGVVALQQHCSFVGYDVDKKSVDISALRLTEAAGDKTEV
jgi:site-specific DNA-methyltransferase (adenine-specific)